MRTQHQGRTLAISGVGELNAANAGGFRDDIRAALQKDTTTIDIDLSVTTFVDSSGLGALIALQKTMTDRGGVVRIVNPRANVLQILELTRLHRVFEILKT